MATTVVYLFGEFMTRPSQGDLQVPEDRCHAQGRQTTQAHVATLDFADSAFNEETEDKSEE
jgi:hypothetical protein